MQMSTEIGNNIFAIFSTFFLIFKTAPIFSQYIFLSIFLPRDVCLNVFYDLVNLKNLVKLLTA